MPTPEPGEKVMQLSHGQLSGPSVATAVANTAAAASAPEEVIAGTSILRDKNEKSEQTSERFPRLFRMDKIAVTAALKHGKKIRATILEVAKPTDNAKAPTLAAANKTAPNKKSKKNAAHAHNKATKFTARVHVGDTRGGPKSENAGIATQSLLQTGYCGHSRIAIAVPKRLLKSAVSRNAVKRWIREIFRRHAVRQSGADMLITLEEKLNPKISQHRKDAQLELKRLFAEVLRRLPVQSSRETTLTTFPVQG